MSGGSASGGMRRRCRRRGSSAAGAARGLAPVCAPSPRPASPTSLRAFAGQLHHQEELNAAALAWAWLHACSLTRWMLEGLEELTLVHGASSSRGPARSCASPRTPCPTAYDVPGSQPKPPSPAQSSWRRTRRHNLLVRGFLNEIGRRARSKSRRRNASEHGAGGPPSLSSLPRPAACSLRPELSSPPRWQRLGHAGQLPVRHLGRAVRTNSCGVYGL